MRWHFIKIRWCDFLVISILKCIPPQTNVIPILSGVLSVRPILLRDMLGQDRQKTYIISNGYFLCLSCPRAALALEQGEFMPRGFLASKDPFSRNVLYVSQSKVWGEDTAENRLVTIIQRSTEVRDKKDFVLEKSCLLEVFGLWGLKPGTALISCHDSFHKEEN